MVLKRLGESRRLRRVLEMITVCLCVCVFCCRFKEDFFCVRRLSATERKRQEASGGSLAKSLSIFWFSFLFFFPNLCAKERKDTAVYCLFYECISFSFFSSTFPTAALSATHNSSPVTPGLSEHRVGGIT